jgi:tetratricopeptide (TPR) repeat protein
MKPRDKAWPLGFLLILATLAAYWPALNNDFISFDDREYVTENPHVVTGLTWSNAAWAFRAGFASNWHPLTWLSHQLDVQLFGLNPRWHHFTSLLFHITNSVLLLFLLRRMTGALWRSAFVAALFALHPLHVESVAWVAERKDVLSTFFFMLTLIAYVRYAERGRKIEGGGSKMEESGTQESSPPSITNHPASSIQYPVSSIHYPPSTILYLLALLLFALGLMSKPMLVTLPFVLLLLDYWPLQRFGPSPRTSHLAPLLPLLVEKLPFFALSAISSVITFLVQSRSQAMPEGMPLEGRLANAFATYLRYLGKTIWPTNLAIFYSHPNIASPDASPWGWQTLAAVLVVLFLSGCALTRRKREPWFAVGWFWYLGTLVPVIGAVQVGGQAMADRYTYIPLIGVFIMVAWGLAEVLSRVPFARARQDGATIERKGEWSARLRSCGFRGPQEQFARSESCAPAPVSGHARFASLLCAAAGLVVLAACAVVTCKQVGYWKSTFTVFEHALKATKYNPVAHCRLGEAYGQQDRYELAESHFRAALREAPASPEAFLGLAVTFERQGKHEEALEQFLAAARVAPSYAPAHNYVGLMYMQRGKVSEAVAEFAKAVSLDPELPAAHSNLAAALLAAGRSEEAEAQYRAALEGDPRNPLAHFGLANILSSRGRREEAVFEYETSLRLSPRNPAALNDLAWIRAAACDSRLRNGTEAVKLAEQACQLTAFHEPLLIGTLAAAYAEAGRFEEAIKTGERAKALALAGGKSALAARNEELLTLYRARKAYHEAK